MNKFASQILNVLDRALAGRDPAWTFHNVHDAKAAIAELDKEIGAAGLPPQDEFTGWSIKGANLEYNRRRELLAAAKETSGPVDARPSIAKPVASPAGPGVFSSEAAAEREILVPMPTIAIQAGGPPVIRVPLGKSPRSAPNRPLPTMWDADRGAHLRHEARIYNVAVGNERLDVLEIMVARAKAEHAAKQKADDAAWMEYLAERKAHPEPSGPLNTTTFGAMIDERRGRGFAKQLAERPILVDCSREGLVAAMNAEPPFSHRWHMAKEALEKHTRANQPIEGGPAEEARKFEVFRRYASSQGWTIPGLDLKGCPATIDPEAAARPRQMAADNMAVAAFLKVLAGDIDGGRSVHPAAECARKLIAKATGKKFVLGATLNPPKL